MNAQRVRAWIAVSLGLAMAAWLVFPGCGGETRFDTRLDFGILFLVLDEVLERHPPATIDYLAVPLKPSEYPFHRLLVEAGIVDDTTHLDFVHPGDVGQWVSQ